MLFRLLARLLSLHSGLLPLRSVLILPLQSTGHTLLAALPRRILQAQGALLADDLTSDALCGMHLTNETKIARCELR